MLRATGTLDLTGSWQSDQTTGTTSSVINGFGVEFGTAGPFESYSAGVDLLPVALAALTVGLVESGPRLFIAQGSFALFTDSGATDNDADDLPSQFEGSTIIRFAATDFEAMGLDAHELDTDIGLWQNSTVAGLNGRINFRVSTIPEPSSVVLLGLVFLSGVFRRSR